jgi:hypothetical protein
MPSTLFLPQPALCNSQVQLLPLPPLLLLLLPANNADILLFRHC